MKNQHGFEDSQWQNAKQEIKTILVQVAKRKGRIAYSELAEKITAVSLEARDSRLFHLLDDVSREEDADGRGMLTAIVVHKTGDMQPGPGFYELAKFLGRNTNDLLACWIAEFNKVHNYWANQHKD